MEQNGVSKKITRRRGACTNCKQRKTRCDGNRVCSHCMKSNLDCTYGKSGNSFPEKDPTQSPRTRDEDNSSLTNLERPPSSRIEYDITNTSNGSSSPLSLSISNHSQPFQELSRSAHPLSEHSFGSIDLCSPLATRGNAHNAARVFEDRRTATPDGWCNIEASWGRLWSKYMCVDYSTLSPISFLKNEDLSTWSSSITVQVASRLSAKMASLSQKLTASSTLPPTRSTDQDVRYSPVTTGPFIEAFFDETYRHNRYVSRKPFDAYLDRFHQGTLRGAPDEFAFLTLFNGVLAMGQEILSGGSEPSPSSGNFNAMDYFSTALSNRSFMMTETPSLLQCQALLTLLLFVASSRDQDLCVSLLASVISVMRSLRLYRNCSSPYLDEEDSLIVANTFWQIYAFEKQTALRFGHYSLIDDDFIETQPPTVSSNSIGLRSPWDSVHYNYSRLCSAIMRNLYSKVSHKRSADEISKIVSHLQQALMKWNMSIPSDFRPSNCIRNGPLVGLGATRQQQLDLCMKFCEATFAIHRWSFMPHASSQSLDVQKQASKSQDACLDAAKLVLALVQAHQGAAYIRDSWYCLQMPVLASCILFLSIVRKKEVKHELACLGIACGYFGHLAMSEADTPGLFHEINQLNTLAFQHINRTRTILDPMLETANLGVDQATVTSSNAIDFTDMSEGLGSMFDFTDISLDFSSDTLDISQGF